MAIEIKGFIGNTLIDWEGKIACEIFLPKCNFRCPYCHAKDLVLESHELNTMPQVKVIDYLKANKKWIDGLVICGGEPTIYKELPVFIKEFRDQGGIQIKLDTNGSNPNMIKELIQEGLVDYIAMDIKAPLQQERYENLVRKKLDINDIISSVNILMVSNIDYEFRTTVSKEWLSIDDLMSIGKSIKGAKRYRLQKFVKKDEGLLEDNLQSENYKEEEFNSIVKALKKYIPDCKYR